jgi:hypothetical protein
MRTSAKRLHGNGLGVADCMAFSRLLLLPLLVRRKAAAWAHAGRHVANAGVASGKVFERSFWGDRV